MRIRFRRFAVLVLAPLALAACGESNREVIAKYAPQFEPVRAELAAMAAGLPEPGSAVTGKLADPTPVPVYDLANGAFNTAILPVEALADEKPAFDLLIASELANALAWAGPKNPMAASALDETAEGFAEQFQAALATPVIVLYRTVGYDPPRAVDEKTFEGGTARVEAFVFVRAGAKLVATCAVDAASAEDISYSYKKGEDPSRRLEAFAASTLWENALRGLARCLADTTGGTFVFQRN